MLNNLYHYLIVLVSGEFDRDYYLSNYEDVRNANINPLWHYINHGWKEGRNPSPKFNTRYYLKMFPDVRIANINPLVHYIQYGKKEGRTSNPHEKAFVPKNDQHTKAKGNEIDEGLIEKAQDEFRKASARYHEHPKLYQNSENLEDIIIDTHIGQGKTGTSLIQNFLDVNRYQLAHDHSYIYPNFSSTDMTLGRCHNHAVWYQSTRNNEKKLSHDLDMLLQNSFIHSVNSVILSNEAWELDNESLEFFKYILKYNPRFKIKVICYIRRIDFWIESAWKQWGLKTFDNIEEYYQKHKFNERYERTFNHLEHWADLIGVENIIVRPYEKKQLNKGLLHDFMSTINIDFDSYKWNKTEDINLASNAGFNRDILEILHYCRNLFSSETSNQLFDLFSSLLGKEFQKKPFEPYSFLSPQQRLDIISRSGDAEQRIANKFMGRESGKIFHDPLPNPDEPWQSYEGLTLEKAVPIIIKMIEENNRLIQNLQKKISETTD